MSRDVRITCRKWNGDAYAHFLSSFTTDWVVGKQEYRSIEQACEPTPLGEGYAYEYKELMDGVEVPDSARVVYHRTRVDLF